MLVSGVVLEMDFAVVNIILFLGLLPSENVLVNDLVWRDVLCIWAGGNDVILFLMAQSWTQGGEAWRQRGLVEWMLAQFPSRQLGRGHSIDSESANLGSDPTPTAHSCRALGHLPAPSRGQCPGCLIALLSVFNEITWENTFHGVWFALGAQQISVLLPFSSFFFLVLPWKGTSITMTLIVLYTLSDGKQ